MEYLESINKIAYDNENYTVYIWSHIKVSDINRKDLEWKRRRNKIC